MNTDKIYAEAVANEYSVKTTTKVKQLKRLDKKAKLPGKLFGWIFGSVATLIFGTGLCFVLGKFLSGTTAIVTGSILGVIGAIGMSVNFPIYKKISQKNKQKYASDIITLAKSISEEK